MTNIREDFEMVYLRHYDVRRFVQEADIAVMDDPNFKRSIGYVVSSYQKTQRYRDFFSNNGFEDDDLRSIATVFGLTFVGRQTVLNRNPKDFYLMIRYVGQRMHRFMLWVAKKFSNDDAILISSAKIMDGDQPISMAQGHPVSSLDERFGFAKEDLEDVRLKIAEAGVSRDLTSQETLLESQTKLLRAQVRARNSADRQRSVILKSKLMSDPTKYSEQLCYYATTKAAPYDVRRAARIMCRKLGIDYKAWLKAQVASERYDSSEFSY